MADTKRTLEIVMRVKDAATTAFKKLGTAMLRAFKAPFAIVKKLGSSLLNLKTIVGGFVAFVAARKVFSFFTETAQALDFIIKSSDRLQITTDSLQELAFVADLAGVNFESFASGLSIVSKNLDNARRGSILQADAFKTLGVEINSLPIGPGGKIDIIELLAQMADSFNDLGDSVTRNAALLNSFGRQGTMLGPLLAAGSAEIRAQARELRERGGVFSPEMLGRAALFNDAMTRLTTQLSILGKTLFVDVAPKLSAIVDALARFAQAEQGGIIGFIKKLGVIILEVVDAVLQGIIGLIRAIEGLVSLLKVANKDALQQQANLLLQNAHAAEKFAKGLNMLSAGATKAQLKMAGAFPTASGTGIKFTDVVGFDPFSKEFVDNLKGDERVLRLASRARELLAQSALVRQQAHDLQAQIDAPLANLLEKKMEQFKGFVRDAIEGMKAGARAAGDNVAGKGRPKRGFQEGMPSALGTPRFDVVPGQIEKADTALEHYLKTIGNVQNAMQDFGLTALSALSNMGDLLIDVVTKTKSAGEAFKQLALQVVRQLANIALEFAIVGTIRRIAGLAEGGVTKGVKSTVPVRKYAEGGIAREPQIAIFGEAGEEAFVPLKNGRIPVSISGGGGGGVTINIEAVDGASVARLFTQHRGVLWQLMTQGIAGSNKQLRSAVRGA